MNRNNRQRVLDMMQAALNAPLPESAPAQNAAPQENGSRCSEAKALAPAGAAPDGVVVPRAELDYLILSTAPDGQWADQAVHSFVKAMLAAAPAKGAE